VTGKRSLVADVSPAAKKPEGPPAACPCISTAEFASGSSRPPQVSFHWKGVITQFVAIATLY